MAYKFKPDKITRPGIYEIRVYKDKVLKSGKIKHRYEPEEYLKYVLWGRHKILQREIKQKA